MREQHLELWGSCCEVLRRDTPNYVTKDVEFYLKLPDLFWFCLFLLFCGFFCFCFLAWFFEDGREFLSFFFFHFSEMQFWVKILFVLMAWSHSSLAQ